MTRRNEAIAYALKNDVRAFTDFVFRELHPGQKLKWHWYLDVIADRVDAVLKGRTNRLVVNAPPRTLKTMIATLALIALFLGRDPRKRVLLITGSQGLANDLMTRLRRLMGSDRYQGLFPQLRPIMAGTTIQTGHGGGVRSATVGQQLSGHGADLVVVDDPLSPSHAADERICNGVNQWFDAEVLQRLNNRDSGALVLVMQRVGSNDLSSHLGSSARKFEFVVLPSIATRDENWLLSDGRCRSRRKGTVLHADTDSPEKQLELWNRVGDYVYATQYLQDTCGSKDEPAMMRHAPKPPDWKPEMGLPGGALCTVTYRHVILHRAFGHPMPEYASWLFWPAVSEEEWEAAAIIQQRRLVAETKRFAENARSAHRNG